MADDKPVVSLVDDTPANVELLRVFDAWLLALKARARIDELYNYRMLGEATKNEKATRWSVLRILLHWVD